MGLLARGLAGTGELVQARAGGVGLLAQVVELVARAVDEGGDLRLGLGGGGPLRGLADLALERDPGVLGRAQRVADLLAGLVALALGVLEAAAQLVLLAPQRLDVRAGGLVAGGDLIQAGVEAPGVLAGLRGPGAQLLGLGAQREDRVPGLARLALGVLEALPVLAGDRRLVRDGLQAGAELVELGVQAGQLGGGAAQLVELGAQGGGLARATLLEGGQAAGQLGGGLLMGGRVGGAGLQALQAGQELGVLGLGGRIGGRAADQRLLELGAGVGDGPLGGRGALVGVLGALDGVLGDARALGEVLDALRRPLAGGR